MAINNSTSKCQHYLQVLERQPGITENMTIKELKALLDDEEKAAKIDSQLEQPFYNQAKLAFQRLNKTGQTVLMTCKPTAVKLYLVLAHHKNQSNVICISRPDLAKIAEMSKPTINAASEELIYKGLMIIERGNEGQGEAITYILNPEVLASGKIIYQKSLVYHYWEKAGEDAEQRFRNILEQAEMKFSAEFQIEDVTIRGEVEPQAKIIKKGKEINQNKKNDVSAGHTDTTTEPYTGSTLQDDSNRKGRKNQVSDTVNMQNNCDILTPEENNLFSGTLAGGTKNEASANQ